MAAVLAPAITSLPTDGMVPPHHSIVKDPSEEPARRPPSRKQTPSPQPTAPVDASALLAAASGHAFNNNIAPVSLRIKKQGGPGERLRSPRMVSQGAGYPSPFSQHDNAPLDSPMGDRSSHMHHMGGPVAYPPYMLYPVGSISYAPQPQEPGSPHANPSPLMGSPVGTPTAMMFPQTPFAGAHQNPFSHHYHQGGYGGGYATDVPISPHASGRVSYFHPMFNNFPFMGLQSLASLPHPQGGDLRRAPSVNQQGQQHGGQRAGSISNKPGEAGGMAGGHAGHMNMNGGGGMGPGGPGGVRGPTPPGNHSKQPSGNGLLMGQPSYGASGVPPHIDTQVEADSPDQAVTDASMLTGMFGAMHMHPYGGGHMPVFMGMPDAMTMQQLGMNPAQQALLAQQLNQHMGHMGSPGMSSFGAQPDPSSPRTAAAYMLMHGGHMHGGSMQGGAAWGPMLGMPPPHMNGNGMPGNPGMPPGFEMWDFPAMYGLSMQALGLGGAGPGMPGADMWGGAGGNMYRGADHMGGGVHGGMGMQGGRKGARGPQPGMPPPHMPGGGPFPGFQLGVPGMMPGSPPGPHGHMAGPPPPPPLRRPGPSPLGGAPLSSPSVPKQLRRPGGPVLPGGGLPAAAAGLAADAKAGSDSQPRLNARQRRTLRRARERVIKGLMEAGRLLLQRHGGADGVMGPASAGSGGGGDTITNSPTSTATPTKDDKSGLDGPDHNKGDGSSTAQSATSSGLPAQDHLAATNLYFQAAMQVAGGSHGPEAAADATSVLSQVAAELEDADLAELINTLSTTGGQGGVDDSLIRDLQIIQNLMGALRSSGAAGAGAPVTTIPGVALSGVTANLTMVPPPVGMAAIKTGTTAL